MDDILRKIERSALVVLVLTCALYIHKFNAERDARETAEIAAKGLPKDVLAKYILENNRLTELVKNAQGKTEVKTVYVADEGKVEVVTKERDEAIKKYQALLDQLKTAKNPAEVKLIQGELKTVSDSLNKPPDIVTTTRGFTSRFGYGLAMSPGHTLRYTASDGTHLSLPISPQIDWKYGYWDRYSGLIQANVFYIGPEFTRHVDDLTPRWLHMTNTEVGVSGGLQWTGGWALGLNTRTNL